MKVGGWGDSDTYHEWSMCVPTHFGRLLSSPLGRRPRGRLLDRRVEGRLLEEEVRHSSSALVIMIMYHVVLFFII